MYTTYAVDLIKETGAHCEAKVSARFNAMDTATFNEMCDRQVDLTLKMWRLADMHQMDRESIEGGYGSHAAYEAPADLHSWHDEEGFRYTYEMDQV